MALKKKVNGQRRTVHFCCTFFFVFFFFLFSFSFPLPLSLFRSFPLSLSLFLFPPLPSLSEYRHQVLIFLLREVTVTRVTRSSSLSLELQLFDEEQGSRFPVSWSESRSHKAARPGPSSGMYGEGGSGCGRMGTNSPIIGAGRFISTVESESVSGKLSSLRICDS